MKKTLGVISLAVLLSVQILTPVTYAVGDDDFVSETYVEESASEEIVEATDDTDEVYDEVSEEDDASEEVTEEDSSDEDSQVEDTLDGDEDSEDTEESDALEEEVPSFEGEEVSVGSSEESVSEESPVLSEEDDAFIAKLSKQGSVAKIAEELGINWYTDSSEIAVLAGIEGNYYGTKEQNNIIREYLISHALELLKKNVPSEDVVEEVTVEEAVSSEVELTGLNEKEISGSKYYNGVVVNVLAPAKSFPEGTTLSITPIKKKNELNEIKEQLVDSQEQITEESTVVAFDISFLYSGEEVQPVTGQTVQVTFNYENHEKLSDAEQDEEKELKVYHLNDKNEEGNKIEDISEVKVEEVEIVKNEEGELVVDAESFSIYTIVTQVHDEGPTDDQLANFEYGEISIARPDSLDASEYPKEGFTIMDRNLGASEIGVGADALTGSYGYYYQWGNNYGFSPYKNISTSLGAINVPNNEYSGSTFITPEEAYAPWMNPINTNLWQGQSRGPCPAGWHVPTASEWSDLGMYYARYYEEEDEGEVSMNCNGNGYTCFNGEGPFNGFINQFKIPFAGGLNSDASPWSPKTYVQLRSSSLDEDYPEQVYLFYAQGKNIVFSQRDDNGGYGFPVRCFKDTYSGTGDVHTITFVFNGGSGSTAAINVLSGEKAIEPSEPVKEGYVFDGWYSGDNVVAFDFDNTSITGDITLTAKYLRTATIVGDDSSRNAFKYGTIQIGDYVLMDRNLGAKEVWDGTTWNVSTEADYYGYYYQWGNNWGFSSKTTSLGVAEQVTVPEAKIPSKYSNSNWNPFQPWSIQTNLWGDDTNTDEARQGPCPDGWHVPSSGEWMAIYNTWNSSLNKTTFVKDLKLPPAGHHNDSSPLFDSRGSEGEYWSSTPNPLNNEIAYALGFTSSNAYPDIASNRSRGYSVRCLQNSPVPQTYTLTFDATTNGGTGVTTGNVELQEDETINLGNYTGTKAGYTFVGWNTNSGAHEKLSENYDNYSISEDTTLYAIFKKTLSASFELVDEDAASSVASPVTCEMFNNDEPCEIESPLLAANVGYVADGWSITSGSHLAEATTFIDGGVYYSVTHYSTPLRAAFIVQDEDAVEEINFLFECYRYNGESSCSITSPNLTAKDGYTIIGWNTDSGANESSLSFNAPIEISTNTMYYSITKNNTPITVTFNVNGNGGSGTTKTCYRFNGASSCFITSPNITPANGYSVIGWSTANDNHINLWQVGEPKDFSESSIYYAQTRKYITAVFYGNGNKLQGDVDQIVTTGYAYNGGTLIVDVPVIQNNAYTDEIIGYSLSSLTGSEIANIGGVILNSGTIADGTAKIQRSDDITLYAQTYKPAVTRTVTYKKGEGDDAKAVLPFDPYSRSCTIAAIYNGNNGVPQATGCELVAPEILVANNYEGYWDGPMSEGDQYTVYSDRTISAYSTGEHYSISFYLDGGEWPTGVTQQDSYQEGDTVEIHEPIWTGYTFIGWTTGSNTVPVKNISIQPSDRGSKLFVAHWQQDEYRIIYSDTVQGTTNLVSTYSYENGATLVAPNKSPMGYHFKGWIGENGDTPETSVTIPAGVVGDKYFTAVWEAESYTVTGHLNGGNIGGETTYVFTYDIESGNIALGTPTRENSTFVGWTGSNGSSPDLNVVIPQGSHGDKEYYAVYDCNEGYEANGNTCVLKPYSITYVLDGGKQTTVNPQETVTRDETSYKINIKNPIKTGYNFQGWMTNIGNLTCKEGVIVRDNCRAESENDLTIEFTEGQAVTLTAKWTHVPIEVTQQDLIGTTPTGIAVVTQYDYENGRVDLAAEIMTGYKTKGWSLDTNGVVVYNDQTKEYVKGLNITYDNPTAVTGGTGRVSLYSVRELINYDIKYLTDEGVHNNPLTYNVTQQDIVLSDAEKTGYVFKGWYDVDEKKVETITSETIAELTSPYKLTLTAKWQASKNTKYHVYHERAWIDGNYYKLSGDLTDVDELTGETNTSVIAQRRTNYEGFIMPVDQQTAKIEADGSTEIIYQYEREKNTYKYNTVVGATTAWKRSIDTNYSTDSSIQQMYYETPIILSGRANTGYSWSGWDVTIGTETTRIEGINENHEHTIIMPLTNVEVTPVVYHIPYTLTYNVNGGTGNESELQEVSPIYYDSGIIYPVVTRMGYTFLGWFDDNGTEDKSDDVYYGSGDDANNKKMPNGNLNLVAHWSANPFVLKVNHYQMDLTGNYPSQPKEVSINTTIDADITSGNNANILPETYTGFTLSGDAVESIHINPDGTTKIDYYYIRDKHNVTVNTNEGVTLSGTLSGSYYYQTPVSVEAIINEGYTWSGWNVTSGENEPVFTTDTGVAFILGTGNVILTPLTTTNSYHLTIKNDGTLVFSGDVLYKTNISQYLTTPSRAGYTFNGWSNRPANDLMPAKDLVIEAKWTYKSNGGGGGGGGGSSSSDDKKVIINNTGDKQQEHSSAELTGTNLTGTNKDLKENEVKEEQPEKAITDMNFDELKNLSADKLKKVDRTKLTKEENEILDAYQWAYEHNVTTMVTLNDANPEGVVTRGHLAKMVVNYAINVLGQQIPEKIPSECRWSDGKKDWESDEIKDYAVKACALGLMGLDMKKFSPNLRVTRAQFGTIMSRLLWGKKYAGGTPYYRKHLNALKLNNIMTQIQNPEGRVELRQWVWLMLMRAGEEK